MSATALQPTTPAEVAEAVRSAPRVIPVGAGTKSRLAHAGGEYQRISLTGVRGIVEYEPSEYTFTALAGTPVKEIVAALAERGQYLPFDPVLLAAGATLGGTVAAGISGPGRLRFGGLRDFILGAQFVDGEGRLLRMGGKVVKNAAGFDVPKFLIGGAGRFGVLTELTFKVFPRPETTRTLRLEAKDATAKKRILTEAANTRWELQALDAALEEGALFARLGGPAAALDALAAEILARFPGAAMTSGDAAYLWQSLIEFRWVHTGGTLVKIALTPAGAADFISQLRAHAGVRGWISAGGNVGYLSVPPGAPLPPLPWPAVTLRGGAALWPGFKPRFEIMGRIKAALDPQNRFPGLDE